jgi:uncharacterized protein DUF262
LDILHPEYRIEEYAEMVARNEIRVNRDYQRSDEVWPRAAQSFLIETILTDFPVPKLFLHSKTDLRTKKTIKEIVDGQQRTKAITDFFNDAYRLSRNVELGEAKGKLFSQLPEDLQQGFKDYSLQFDLFIGATDQEVREVFRRMNSFTVPLNPEEQRHADYQGEFKWFMRSLSSDYGEAFRAAGTFSQKALVRMQDQKLLTEVCSAYFDGITTTSKTTLTRVYREHDKDEAFPQRDELDGRIRDALDWIFDSEELFETPLAKPHQMYALILAVMHLQTPIDALLEVFDSENVDMADDDIALVNLTRLAEVLEGDDVKRAGSFKAFYRASAEKTNVEKQRAARFTWFCKALVDDLPS